MHDNDSDNLDIPNTLRHICMCNLTNECGYYNYLPFYIQFIKNIRHIPTILPEYLPLNITTLVIGCIIPSNKSCLYNKPHNITSVNYLCEWGYAANIRETSKQYFTSNSLLQLLSNIPYPLFTFDITCIKKKEANLRYPSDYIYGCINFDD